MNGRPAIRQTSYAEPAAPEPSQAKPSQPKQGRTESAEAALPPAEPLEVLPTESMDVHSDAAWLDQPGQAQVYAPLPLLDSWAYWGRFDFLLWWHRQQDLPPLVTSSPLGTPVDQAGRLDQPATQILYGSNSPEGGSTVGGRVTIGAWTDCSQTCGFGVRYFALGNRRSEFQADSDTTPILARPFFNVTLNVQDADVVAYPNDTIGQLGVSNVSRVHGGDAFWRRLFYADSCHRLDLLVGYQVARLGHNLAIDSQRTVIRQGGSIPFGTVVNSSDVFDTENTYHAGAIGMIGEYDRGNVTWRLLAKVGLGNMRQEVAIHGLTTTSIPGQATTVQRQGLLARQSNIGSYSQDVFAVSPEIGLNMAYHLSDHVDVTLGYSFLYWNRVALPASQIDMGIETRAAAATRPAFALQDTDYLLHGLNVGLQWVY
jgi:hypothetical protein